MIKIVLVVVTSSHQTTLYSINQTLYIATLQNDHTNAGDDIMRVVLDVCEWYS